MREEIENPIISDQHPIKDPQAHEPDIYAECDGCGEFIYDADSEHIEFLDGKRTIYLHDDDQCLALWIRSNSELVTKNDR